MSLIHYISFPRKLKAYRLSDIRGKEKELGINYDTSKFRDDIYLFPDVPKDIVVLVDIKTATFDNCFKNQFVYEYGLSLPPEFYDDNSGSFGDDTKKQEFLKQALYNFAQNHLEKCEFIERYYDWTNHVDFHFGPPNGEITMTLEEYLILPSEYTWPPNYTLKLYKSK